MSISMQDPLNPDLMALNPHSKLILFISTLRWSGGFSPRFPTSFQREVLPEHIWRCMAGVWVSHQIEGARRKLVLLWMKAPLIDVRTAKLPPPAPPVGPEWFGAAMWLRCVGR